MFPAEFAPLLIRAMPRVSARRLSLGVSVIATAVVIALIYVGWVSVGPLWRDEATTVNIALAPTFARMWEMIRLDTFPLLPSLMIRGWTTWFGSASDLEIRGFGFAVGVSTVLSIWGVSRLLGNAFPVVSLGLLALSPSFLETTTAIRPHGPGLLFLILTYGLLWKVVTSSQWRWSLLAALVATICLQCSYGNAALLSAMFLGAVCVAVSHKDWNKAIRVIGVGLVAVLSLAPYAQVIAEVAGWAPVIAREIHLDEVMASLWRTLRTHPRLPWFLDLRFLMWTEILVAGVVIFITAKQFKRRLTRKKRAIVIYHLVTVFAGLPMLSLLLIQKGICGNPAYFVPWVALAALASQTLLEKFLVGREWRWFQAFLLLAIVVSAGPIAHRQLSARKSNLDIIADVLRERAKEGDYVVVFPWPLGVSFARYYQGRAPWTTLPPFEDHLVHRFDLLRDDSMTSVSSADNRKLLKRLDDTLRRGSRIWLVGDRWNPYADEMEAAWTESMLDIVRERGLYYEEVSLPKVGNETSWEIVPLYVTERI